MREGEGHLVARCNGAARGGCRRSAKTRQPGASPTDSRTRAQSPQVLPSVDLSDQEFTEPVALSSTSPADFPLGHLPKDQPSTYSRPVKLRSSRAPCSAQDRAYLAGAVAGKERHRGIVRILRTSARAVPSAADRCDPAPRHPRPGCSARAHPGAQRARRRRRSHALVSWPKTASTAWASRTTGRGRETPCVVVFCGKCDMTSM